MTYPREQGHSILTDDGMVARTQVQRQSGTPKLLRDVVDVKSHPTVVRLDHLDAADATWISSNYYLTDEVRRHLASLQTALAEPTGCGAFVVGQYGSGKSHLLAYVAQQLRESASAEQTRRPETATAGPLKGSHPDVVTISLLDHRAERVLEDIVLEALSLPDSQDRRQTWTKLTEQYPHGVLLIIDELSEFLRSKPTPAVFHEDVRFLQFLGEWAQGHRLWILAAMQEQIEHLGDLEHGMYRKIKDRFPLRFILTPSHVFDLVSESILVKKQGYPQEVDAIIRDLREVFPNHASDHEELRSIYPIHPATLELLEEVRDRFSQARGVVDFVVGQLGGVPARDIDSFLDRPSGHLLTPDAIIDHFCDLFELQSDFVPLSQQLLPYYRKHLRELFESEKLVELAWRVIKLLMLVHISPVRDGLTATEAVRWLSYQASRIDPGKNLAVIQRVMDTIVDRGRYVARQDGHYTLNLRDDGGAALDRFLDREKEELRHLGTVVLESLIPLLTDSDFHPFSFRRDQWHSRRLRWHFHERAYWAFVGDSDPDLKEGLTICLRLPWGDQSIPSGIRTLRPAVIEVGEEVIELAALVRARERFWSGKAASRLESRYQERLRFFQSQMRNAYREAQLFGPDGQSEPAPRIDSSDSFATWTDKLAVVALRRNYPSFERFAPVHGPLPNEAYRALMRFVAEFDLGAAEANDEVRLIREAYLVPMNLLKRKGRDYAWPKHAENAELVRLVLPLVETETAPKFVYDQLQGPVYGLVSDQVSLLLIYLLILGEIDILKGKISYRESFETLPNPVQYDRIVPGRALRADQVRELTTICEALQIRLPGQMTVMAQRRAAAELCRQIEDVIGSMKGLHVKLLGVAGGKNVAERLVQFLHRAEALQQGENQLHAFQQFMFEVGTAQRFLRELSDFQQLADRLDGILESLKRYQHLFSHPVMADWDDTNLVLQVEALGAPPDLEHVDALNRWLDKARSVYTTYRDSYQDRHLAFWEKVEQHPVWTWQPHALASSQHVGLEADLEKLKACSARAKELRCRGLANLDFQPACHCGFDGKTSPIAAEIEPFEGLQERIESSLAHFFAQKKVRLRVKQWLAERIEVNTQTLAYVEGKSPLPAIVNLALFDQYLAGIELVKEINSRQWCELFAERTWEPDELAATVGQYLQQFTNARVRLKTERAPTEEIVKWCVEQCLRRGIALPPGVDEVELQAVADSVQPAWVGKRALAHLEQLGLGSVIENQIATWIVEAQIDLAPQTTDSPLVETVRELLRPTDCETAAQLAEQSQQLYRQHARMMRIAPQTWLKRLDRLARQMPSTLPDKLTDLLQQHEDVTWVVIDALGLPLMQRMQDTLEGLFPSWRRQRVEYALVSSVTTTDQWYRDLLDSGTRRPLEKLNAVDALLHERFVPLDDLWRLALAELTVGCRQLVERLPTDRPLLIFADHGFRIAADGRSYGHGGDSALERLVPLFFMVPHR